MQIVENADERLLLRLLLEQFRNPQAISAAAAGVPVSPSRARSGCATSPSGSVPSCLRISTTGQ
jgi:hypothetical protein